MNPLFLVGMREIRVRYASKLTRITIAVLFVMVIGAPWISHIHGLSGAHSVKVGVAADTKVSAKNLLVAIEVASHGGLNFTVAPEIRPISDSPLEELNSKGFKAYMVEKDGKDTIYYTSSTSSNVIEFLRTVSLGLVQVKYLETHGVNSVDMNQYVVSHSPILSNIDSSSKSNDDGIFLSIALITLLYSLILMSGSSLAIGIVEEKSSKIIEIILSSITPRQLLTGKVFGIAGFSFLQFVALVFSGLVSSKISGSLNLHHLTTGTLAQFALWFIPAVLFYSYLFVGLGATVSRMEDVGLIQTPLMMLLTINLYAAMFAQTNLDATWVRILAYIPPFSFFLEPTRVIGSEAKLPEILLSFTIAAVTVFGIVIFSSALFETSVLNQGKSIRIREFAKSIHF